MKKKLLRIFLFLITLIGLIVPSESNHPRKVEAVDHTGGYVYFLKPSTWTESTVMMFIGHSSYTSVYTMTKVSNTNNLYRHTMGSWGGATYVAFANAGSAWGSGSWGPDNRTNATHYTNVYNNYGFNSGSYYVCVPASTSNNASLTINYKGNASALNLTARADAYANNQGGTNFTANANAGTVSVSGYYMSAYNTASTRSAVSSSASQTYASTTFAPGSTVTFNATVKTGYEFIGWSTSTSESNIVSTSTTYTFSYNITYSDKQIYALFEHKDYSIKFNKGDFGTGTNVEITKYHGVDITLEDAIFTRVGYTQTGWSLNADGSTKDYELGGSFSTNSEKTLYPYWTINTYTVSLDVFPNGYGTTSGSGTYAYNSQVSISATPNLGYKFTSWDDDNTSNPRTITIGTSNLSYTANFIAKSYNINFDAGDGTLSQEPYEILYNTSIGTLPIAIPPSEEYVFLGWYLDPNDDDNAKINDNTTLTAANFNITSNDSTDITLYARYKELQKFTISFDSNGGLPVESIQVFETLNYGFITSLPSPTREGYSFAGWKYGDTLVTNESKLAVEGNHTLVASWSANPYVATLSQEYATTPAAVTSVTATFDSAMPPINSFPLRTGYIFDGYYSASGGTGTKYYNADGTSARTWNIADSATLYPKWNPINYTIVYDSNGGTGEMNDSDATYNQSIYLTTNAFSREGYTFTGWNTKEDGTGTNYANGASVINLSSTNNGIATLYAKWTPITYTIVLHSNNDKGETKNITATYDSITSLPLDSFTQDGYKITYWSLTEDGVELCQESLSSNLSSTQGATVNLYAHWEIANYEIIYQSPEEFGTMVNNNPVGYTIVSDDIYLQEPTLENYTFAGWTCEELGIDEPTKELTIPKSSTGNLTLVANWNQMITIYIDMSPIYVQFWGTEITNPFIHYYNSSKNSGTFGSILMESTSKTNTFKKDIYLVKNNILQNVNYIENIQFGYTQGGIRTHTNSIPFPIDETCNGKEYLFVYKYSENAILKGYEVGETYTINVTGWSHNHSSSNDKFYNYTISKSSGTAGKVTIKVNLNWSNITALYINDNLITGSNNVYTYVHDYATSGDLTKIDVDFCQPENGTNYWFHMNDTGNKDNTNSYITSENIYSIDITNAPRVNYYDNETLVHSSSYLDSNKVYFIEKEGHKLEGWYYEDGTKFVKDTSISESINVYANYEVANDYYIYVEIKNSDWNDLDNMHVYKWNEYFHEHNNAWPGTQNDITYLGNGIYRVYIDASKSYDKLILVEPTTIRNYDEGNDTYMAQTVNIDMTPTMSYYILSNELLKDTNPGSNTYNRYLNVVYYEKQLDNDIYAQKNVSNTEINEFRFTAGLVDYDDLVIIEDGTVGKEFGYKFIFINGNECYVGYWNFTNNTMLDSIRYDDTLYVAQDNGYKGYYALTLTDDINFKYGNYNQIIVVACYRDNNNKTQIIKAQEFNIVGLGNNVQLYKIER